MFGIAFAIFSTSHALARQDSLNLLGESLPSLGPEDEGIVLITLPSVLENLSDSKVAVRRTACSVIQVFFNSWKPCIHRSQLVADKISDSRALVQILVNSGLESENVGASSFLRILFPFLETIYIYHYSSSCFIWAGSRLIA
jgi:hypothetical protein